jgi:uncharacterized glyoxalase superfamily protein PhnB
MAQQEKPTVSVYLCYDDAAEAIDFYKKVFGATEPGARITEPDGKIGHAEIHIGNTAIMLSDEYPGMGVVSPKSLGMPHMSLVLSVDDVDAVADRAVAAGMEVERPVEDQFYGARAGWFRDPFGYRWSIQTQTETLSNEELLARAAKLYEGQ